jgi:hypothetical protein
MASTYSTNLALELIGTGDQSGTWGTTTNTNLGTLLEQAIVGYTTQALVGAGPTAITIPNGSTGVARNYVLEFTGSPTAGHNVTVPAVQKSYVLFNNTTVSIVVKVSGQTGVTIAVGKKAIVYNNGTDIIEVANAPVTEAGTQTLTNKTLTTPSIATVVGGTAVSSTLTLESTSGAGTSDAILFKTGSQSERMRIDTSGNVGIGISTLQDKLQVLNTLGLQTSATYSYINFRNSAQTLAQQIQYSDSDGSLTIGGGSPSGGAYPVVFRRGTSTESARIDASGNLGIGTSSPSQKLVVNAASGAAVSLVQATASNTAWFSLLGNGSTFLSGDFNFYHDGTQAGIRMAASLPMTFATANTERMRIDSSGNVGIGTSSPSVKLQLYNATADTANYVTSGSVTTAVISSNTNTNGQIGTTTSNPLLLLTGGTERMRIDTSGNLLVGTTAQVGSGKTVIRFTPGVTTGTAYQQSIDTSAPTPLNFLNAAGTSVGSVTTTSSATAYNVSSDYRLKENVTPMTNSLEKISALKPVTYDWIIDKTAGEGFIAHELKKVVPLAVHGEKDDVDADGKPIYQGVDYSKIVVHLVAAIQELKAEFDAYKASHA